MDQRYQDAVVLSRRNLTQRIIELEIGGLDGQALLAGEAGSHVEVRFGGPSGSFLRHYSLVGPLRAETSYEPFLRIAVLREDRSRGSSFIHGHFKASTRLRVSRPLNAFRLSRQPAHTLLVAGGIGITPMFAMARSLTIRKASFGLFFAGFERAGMAYARELEGLCCDRLTLHEARDSGVPDLCRLLAAQPVGTVVYVCGPAPMIEAVHDAARALGWSKERVRFERFSAAHRPEDRDFTVRTRDGRNIKVGAGTTILEALELTGFDTLSDCRRGECGLCLTDVLKCDGKLDHRDRFLSDDERQAGKQMTICCSRITGDTLRLDV